MVPTSWSPPESKQGSVAWSRSWRIISYGPPPTRSVRVYIGLAPASLIQAYEALFPYLEERGHSHRHVRSPQVLAEINRHPGWAGKSVVIDLPAEQELSQVVVELDSLLAGLALSGPPLLALARPVGGRSGLLFQRRDEAEWAADGRRDRLARLLGEEGGG